MNPRDDFTISLSDSFKAEDRVDDVEYVIKQKPKCKCDDPTGANCGGKIYAPVDYATHFCPAGYIEMVDLCRFLSKMPQDPNETEIGEPSYYDSKSDTCVGLIRDAVQASGRLAKSSQDFSDTWTVDLKVPPYEGYVAQDWPKDCPVLSGKEMNPEGTDFGCDLWIEVTEISVPSDRFPLEGTAYIGYEDWTDGDLDYNDFGMDFSAQEYYNTVGSTDYLTRVVMTFEAVIYDSGAEHYIHISRPFIGDYDYTVTRSVVALPSEIAAGPHTGSGNLDVVLFDTAKYNWPAKQIGETVTVEVTLKDPLSNPRMPLTAPRPDLDPFMDNYDPWENPYAGVVGTFNIAHIETIGSTGAQKNTPRIVPIGTDVPFILVIPKTDWVPPFEDTTITAPYWRFTDYYDGTYLNWGPNWPDWYLSLDPAHSSVGTGGLAW